MTSYDMSKETHLRLMRLALTEARKSPPKPTNYCVGAILYDPQAERILATGYTLECEGNTHAEQCALQKFAEQNNIAVENVSDALPEDCRIYTTMEPCNFRNSGNLPCADRILAAGKIRTVFVGVREPETLVSENEGRKKLEDAGIEYVHIPGLEEEILAVATAGHVKS